MIMLAGLALGAVGSIMGSAAQGQQQKAQAQQAEMNRQLQEFEKQYNLEQQRGQMGLAEMQKILRQGQGQKESLQVMLQQKRASREQEEYASSQFSRSFRQGKARAEMSMSSRGAGRGGTADAIKNQLDRDAAADSARIRVNFQNQRDSFENRRNAAMKELFSGPSTPKPPTYFPSTPIPMPDTSGQLAATALGSLGSVVGGMAGMGAANAAPGVGGGSPEAFAGALSNSAGTMSYNPSGPMAGMSTLNNLGLNFGSQANINQAGLSQFYTG